MCRTKKSVNDIKSIQGIVNHYQTNDQTKLNQTLGFYSSLSFDKKGITIIANAKLPNGKRHSHQYRLSQKTLISVTDKLLKIKDDLNQSLSFSDLFKKINSNISEISGVGVLMIYDTSLRLGCILNLKPTKVYLHRGAKTGAKNLGLNVDKSTLAKNEFPNPFQTLEPHEIEDCLCIYKDIYNPSMI